MKLIYALTIKFVLHALTTQQLSSRYYCVRNSVFFLTFFIKNRLSLKISFRIEKKNIKCFDIEKQK